MAKKPYHHGDLRLALLTEARRQIEQNGVAKLSLRECARVVEVDPSAVYRHFRAKRDLMTAVAEVGFLELGTTMAEAQRKVGRRKSAAGKYFVATGDAYIRWGVAHGHLYRLMFGGAGTRDDVPVTLDPDAYALLSDALDLLVDAQKMSARRRAGAEITAWCAVHGLVSLVQDGRMADVGLDVAIERLTKDVLKGLTK